MHLGYIGLGKMGMNMVLRMRDKGYDVIAYNRSEGPREEARKAGVSVADSIGELVLALPKPCTLWLMVSNAVVDEVLKEVLKYLEKGDTVIDGGNSFYKDSIRRAGKLREKGINFLDVGTSGGPSGARHGACFMIGGEQKVFKKYEQLFQDLSWEGYSDVLENTRTTSRKKNKKHSNILQNVGMSRKEYAYAHVGKAGAGHFVKMVHNGIEYGMMQAIAEGFSILRRADTRRTDADRRGKKKFGFDLKQIAKLYNKRSVVESRLVGWLQNAYEKYGSDLSEISGTVAHTGEGEWTVKTAKELGVPVPIIEASFKFRVASSKNPSYIGRVLSALRSQFGGHSTGKN